MMQRLMKHLLFFPWRMRQLFPHAALDEIEAAIRASERSHSGEIRFAIEDSLHPVSVLRGKTARQRALEVFSQLHVWDTEQNNGVLIYLLLAEHRVEIVADRGIDAKVGASGWQAICTGLQRHMRQGHARQGVLEAISAIGAHLAAHFPASGSDRNELADRPTLL